MPIQSERALAALRQKDLLSIAGRIERKRLGEMLAPLYRTDHRADTPAEADERVILHAETAAKFFGVEDDDLVELVSQVAAPGVTGTVQQALSNGGEPGWLITWPAIRHVPGPGGIVTKQKRVGRVFTANPEMVDERYYQPTVSRLESAAGNFARGTLETVGRIPALAPFAEKAILEAMDRTRRALGGGVPPEEGTPAQAPPTA
jgi:hypothetical protein